MRFDIYHHNYSGIELDLLKASHQLLNQMVNQIKELSTKVDALHVKIDKTKTLKKTL